MDWMKPSGPMGPPVWIRRIKNAGSGGRKENQGVYEAMRQSFRQFLWSSKL